MAGPAARNMSERGARITQRLMKGPALAREIAQDCGLSRLEVNQTLYGELKEHVEQRKDYRWEVRAAKPQQPTAPTTNRASALSRYYLDCLAAEQTSRISCFQSSFGDIDYAELPAWPFDSPEVLGSQAVRGLFGRRQRERSLKTLWLGFPVLVRTQRGRRGSEGRVIAPVLIWPLERDAEQPRFLRDPNVNPGIFPQDRNELNAAADLAQELSLDGSSEAPAEELADRLRGLRPDWIWHDEPELSSLRPIESLKTAEADGIYNSAIVVIADKQSFTEGLERELVELSAVPDSDLSNSALGVLLRERGSKGAIEPPIIHAAPLNAEQRDAVRLALSEPFTVITGPPGTGKSQVVTAIAANAAWRGQRVLIASKNHKAVDVVVERCAGLSPMPFVMRLGQRKPAEQIAAAIAAALSARATESDRARYAASLRSLAEGEARLRHFDARLSAILELRNRADALERDAESVRAELEGARHCTTSDIARLSDAIAKFRRCAEASRIRPRTVWARVVAMFGRRERLHSLGVASRALADALRATGRFMDEAELSVTEETLQRAGQHLAMMQTWDTYRSAVAGLKMLPDAGAMAQEEADISEALASASSDLWRSWMALIPDRLDASDRAALGDYAALTRSVARRQQEKEEIESAVWRRLDELGRKAGKALPVTAITSLSVRNRIPFAAAQFDLLIIDEASQCDIASALPLLYRCKRAVVIGDPYQLSHVTPLRRSRDAELMSKYDVLQSPGAAWSYRESSLYDLAASRTQSLVDLRVHFRSHAEIIEFSNACFYGQRLRVATRYGGLRAADGAALRWVDVVGHVRRPSEGGAVNEREARAVTSELRRIVIEGRYAGEVGVVTPFTAHAARIRELINADSALAAVVSARNILVATAHGFQGDERDVMLLSPVLSAGISESASGFLRKERNLFNVAITRARATLVVVGDRNACLNCDVEHLQVFARYVAERETRDHTPYPDPQSGPEYPTVARPELVSPWERVFYAALWRAGIRPICQYEIENYILDFAILREDGRRLNVEIDGEHYHRRWDGEILQRDQIRNLRLIELGWDVQRFWVYQVRDELDWCIARIRDWQAAATVDA